MANYIDREALVADLEKSVVISCKTEKAPQMQRVLSKIMNCIKEQPTSDVAEVKHGKWKKIQNYALCSNCKHEVNWGCKDFLSPYCPECGAKMDKEREQE